MKPFAIFAFASIAAMSAGQSFNIDIEKPTDPELGGGVPSNSFGAAAGTPGVWNSYLAGNIVPQQLFSTAGSLTNVTMSKSTNGSSTAWNNPGMTGDYAALMNDVSDVNGSMLVTFRNVSPGDYQVYTYCGKSFPGNSGLCDVTLGGVTKRIEGVLPNNAFIEGITHSKHTFTVGSDGLMSIQLSGSLNQAYFSGIQVVFVPEPATITVLGAASAALLKMRRKRR